jgi:beta-barrel assembly-enhancing protease
MFAVATIICASALSASPAPQFKPSRSDEDINAIGHRTIGKGTNFYSTGKAKVLGKGMAQEVERSAKLIDDPVVIEYVNRIGQSIAKNSDARFPVTIRVIDTDVVGAFTLPGGYQYINKGVILQTEGEAELAGVLARGIAHTALRHATRQATKGDVLNLSLTPATNLIPYSLAGYGYAMYEGLNLAIPLSTLKYQRDAEREADFFGLEYLYKAGYDPEYLPRFIERMSLQKPPGKSIPKAFDPFPPVSERLEALNNEIAKILPHRDGAIVSTSELQIIKARLLVSPPNAPSDPPVNQPKTILRKLGDHPTPKPPNPTPNCE